MEKIERDRELGRLQMEVLVAVWRGTGLNLNSVAWAVSSFRKGKEQVSTGSVLTTLNRLIEKGYVAADAGKKYLITAAGEKEFEQVKEWGAKFVTACTEEGIPGL